MIWWKASQQSVCELAVNWAGQVEGWLFHQRFCASVTRKPPGGSPSVARCPAFPLEDEQEGGLNRMVDRAQHPPAVGKGTQCAGTQRPVGLEADLLRQPCLSYACTSIAIKSHFFSVLTSVASEIGTPQLVHHAAASHFGNKR